MATTIKTGPINQSDHLVADFSNGISPFFVNGGIISAELTGEGVDYNSSENLTIEIPGATKITFAEIQTAAGVKVAHTIADLSGTTGKSITVATGSENLLRLLVFYRV